MKRRIDGEGSIYSVPTGWVAQISIGGQVVRRHAKTRELALAKLDDLRERRRRRLNLTEKDPRFGDYFELWLATNRKLKAGTRDGYRTAAQRWTLPALEDFRLQELNAALLQEWVGELEDRGLAPNTIKNLHARVRTCLNRAVRARLIDFNPAAGLDLPSGRKRQPIALTEEEASALLAAVSAHRLWPLYVLALTLGMRQGELLALTWGDLSWKAGVLTIRRSLRRVGAKTTEDTAKTEAGERRLELGEDLVSLLRSHWRTQEEERQVAEHDTGAPWNPDRRIFCNELGRPIAARNLLRQFDNAKAAAGLPAGLVFHDLRHTAGSLMLARGHDMLDVSKILGHSSPAVTMKIYAHSYTAKRRAATVDMAAALLGRKSG